MLNIKDLSGPALPKQDNYERALKIGLEAFARKDPGRVAEKAGAELVGRQILLPHLDRHICLDVDNHLFTLRPTGEETPIWLSILAIHYLNNADGRQPLGKLKHFREFKEGSFYEPAFNRRTRDILIAVFGENPEPMKRAGIKLGGKVIESADAAVELFYFPMLPITCLVWRGDDEFPAEGSVLFDETAELFFSAEDMAVAGQMAVLELMKAARQ